MLRKEIKIAGVLFLMLTLSSCGALRRSATGDRDGNATIEAARFSKEIERLNITNYDFRIDRVKVEARIDGETTRFSGNLRYSREGKLLFSARAIAGIEIARIYIDRDVVILIDRINRTYSTGSTRDFLIKYSASWNEIVMLFGDLPGDARIDGKVRCISGYANIILPGPNRKMNVTVDCSSRKISEIVVQSGQDENTGVIAQYRNIKSENNVIYPGEVGVSNSNGKFELKIQYDRLSLFEGNVKQPGRPSGYEIIELK